MPIFGEWCSPIVQKNVLKEYITRIVMGEINLPREQMEALGAIDTAEVDRLLDRAMRDERTSELRQALLRCGEYVGRELRSFEKALDAHRSARAAHKREVTSRDLYKAKFDLSAAVWAMKRRVEEDRKDAELFVVEDAIRPPHWLSRNLSVCVNYRWRSRPEDDWTYGSIEFSHDHDPRPDFTFPLPSRKPTEAQRKKAFQNELYQTWEDLMRQGLYAVRDYFKAGGDGAAIPKTFKATPDAYSRRLNNFSTRFWPDKADG